MIKRILSGLFTLALLATAVYGVNKSMESDTYLSDLVIANVEALAYNENGGEFRAGYIGDYKWVSFGGIVTRIPCCKKITDPHSGCNAIDDC